MDKSDCLGMRFFSPFRNLYTFTQRKHKTNRAFEINYEYTKYNHLKEMEGSKGRFR